MPDIRPERGLLRFVDFYKQLTIDSRIDRAFDELFRRLDQTESAADELQQIVQEVLYGEPTNCC